MARSKPARHAHGPHGVPQSLGDLHGPSEGIVALPLHLAWSGARRYDVSEPAKRLLMYQILITEGGTGDLEEYLDADHLVSVWPMLRRLLHPRYTRPWEQRFPELVEAAEAAEPALQQELERARQAAREGRAI